MIVAVDDDCRVMTMMLSSNAFKARLTGLLLDWNNIDSIFGIPIGTFRVFAYSVFSVYGFGTGGSRTLTVLWGPVIAERWWCTVCCVEQIQNKKFGMSENLTQLS